MGNSSKLVRPTKPRPDFPLFPHASGRWAKKVLGKFVYFGKIADDPKGAAAIELWLDQKDDLLAGRKPRTKGDELTVRSLCNRFIGVKEDALNLGEITRRTYDDYFASAKLVVEFFGAHRPVDDLRSEDFELLRARISKTRNVNSVGNEVQRIRTLFKYGYDAELFEKPIRFGPGFKKPSKRVVRTERHKKGERMFEARQLRRLLKAAPAPMKAMILLGVNCGFGNHDCGRLPLSAVDLNDGWIDFPRPKTAIKRRAPLWPETVTAMREAMEKRPIPKASEHEQLVFVTKYGKAWAKETPDSPVSKEFRKLLDSLAMHRPGLGFYALRHTFETIAGEGADQVAVNAIMGHADNSMSATYRERISDRRLEAASNVVRKWLFRRECSSPWREGRPKITPAI